MLVLTRHPQQSVVIDQQIEITVLGVRGNQVKIGIEAPRHLQIYRREILEKIQKAEQQSE